MRRWTENGFARILQAMDKPFSPALVGWVGRFILPHERHLRSWLRSTFHGLDVDDVVQESYCRIASLTSTDHIRNPQQYLFRTARNVVLEQIRRDRVVNIEFLSSLNEIESAFASDLEAPERVLQARFTLRKVEQLISTLPERAARIFRLRKIDGLSQREIASQLGTTETIVENDLARSLRAILKSIGEHERADLPLRRIKGRINDHRTSNQDR